MLENNPFAIGGLITVAFGAILALLRNLPGKVLGWFLGRYTVLLEVMDKDESFHWVSAWLAEHPDIKRAKNISVVTTQSRDENEKFTVNLIPAPGLNVIRAFGTIIFVTRIREKGEGIMPQKTESFVFRILSKDIGLARRLVDEARDLALRPKEGYADVYLPRWGYWSRAGMLRTRPIATVVLPSGADILGDIENFYASEEMYVRRGIPFQRGYLLYGPPGNGKTSFVRALAGHLKLSIYLVDLRDPKLSDIDLQWLLSSMPRKSILLLEDIDQVVLHKAAPKPAPEDASKPATPEESHGVTMSGLLNALDGIVSGDSGRLVFMTSNNPELLPDNLVRPGRIDMKLEFPNVRQDTFRIAANLFFPRDEIPSVDIERMNLPFAEMQEHFVKSTTLLEAVSRMSRNGHNIPFGS